MRACDMTMFAVAVMLSTAFLSMPALALDSTVSGYRLQGHSIDGSSMTNTLLMRGDKGVWDFMRLRGGVALLENRRTLFDGDWVPTQPSTKYPFVSYLNNVDNQRYTMLTSRHQLEPGALDSGGDLSIGDSPSKWCTVGWCEIATSNTASKVATILLSLDFTGCALSTPQEVCDLISNGPYSATVEGDPSEKKIAVTLPIPQTNNQNGETVFLVWTFDADEPGGLPKVKVGGVSYEGTAPTIIMVR